MKIAAIIGLSVVLIFLGIQAFTFVRQVHQLDTAYSSAQTELATAKAQEANLQDEQQYLANPLNLEKELRAQFNYVNPGEKMIVIVPTASSSASSTSISD